MGVRRRRWAPTGWWSSGWRARPSRARSCATTSGPAPAPALTAQCGARAGRHPHHRPRRDRRAAAGRPAGRPAALPRRARRGAARARARRALAGARTVPPPGPRVTVHGDFRMGNLLVGPDGPARRARLGAGPRRRPGRGHRVAVRAGLALRRAAARWAASAPSTSCWRPTPPPAARRSTPTGCTGGRCYATVKWAVICALQASAHLSGSTRSVELAAIGRRVCESEWDLFALLGVAPGDPAPEAVAKRRPGGALRAADGGRAGRGGARVPRDRRDGAQRGRRALRGAGGAQRAGRRRARAAAGPRRRRRPRAPPARPRRRPTTPRWRRPSGPGTSTTAGSRWRPRWPRRRATSCWWRTPPTCRPPRA